MFFFQHVIIILISNVPSKYIPIEGSIAVGFPASFVLRQLLKIPCT